MISDLFSAIAAVFKSILEAFTRREASEKDDDEIYPLW